MTTSAKKVDFETLRAWQSYQKNLARIAKRLHKLDEKACNFGESPRDEKAVQKLMEEAELIAQAFGLQAYHQSDPRGMALYLMPNDWENGENGSVEQNYNQGICINY